MALFSRRKNSREDTDGDGDRGSDGKKEKGGSRRPANTAFKQQRLKAWQPILTPKTVLPILFIIGIVFAPIGGLLIWGNSKVSEITLPYTGCEDAGSSFSDLPNAKYKLRSGDSKLTHATPRWSFDNSTGTPTCTIEFELPADLKKPVFIYYKLTNFYQNHRRYVKSLSPEQLSGKRVSASDLQSGDCKPLGRIGDQAIYPCGLIANSQFNDTIHNPILLNAAGGNSSAPYNFSFTGIAWPGERKRYVSSPGYNLSEIVPPPNWAKRFPNGYTEQDPPPDLRNDEHFQNWMRTAGLPTFSKLWGRNDDQDMVKGTYNISVDLNFPVARFGGTKSLVLSTMAWSGGKNSFLGWAYVGAAALFVLLAIVGTVRHLVKPRRLGDMNLLSWNQPSTVR